MSLNSFDDYPMSWRPTLERGGAPLAQQLIDQLISGIDSGDLLPGTKLPPQRELADYLGINVSTVSRAFKECSRRGLLTGTVGSGTYVAYGLSADLHPARPVEGKRLIELGSMIPETVPQDEVVLLLREMLSEADAASLFQYSRGVAPWQREAGAKLLARVGCPARAEQVLTSNGGQNALAAVFAALFKPGDRIGVDPLVYPGVKNAARLFGVQLVAVGQEHGEMSEAALRKAIVNEGIQGVYLMPDCQNPTTHTMSAEGRAHVARLAREHDLVVIEDGICGLLADDERRAVFADAPENTVFMLSLSKTVSPALRLAYLAVPDRFYGRIESSLNALNLSQSTLLLELASRLMASGRLDALLERRRAGLAGRNRIVDEELVGLEVWGGPSSLARWLRLPESLSGSEFERRARERGVIVFGSERFAVGRDAPEPAARLAICAPESCEELRRGLAILREEARRATLAS